MTNSLQSSLRMRRNKHIYQDDSAVQKMYAKNTACILMESPQRKSRTNFVQSIPNSNYFSNMDCNQGILLQQQTSAIVDTTVSITFSTPNRVQCRKRKVDETSTELSTLEPSNTFATPVTDVNGEIVHHVNINFGIDTVLVQGNAIG